MSRKKEEKDPKFYVELDFVECETEDVPISVESAKQSEENIAERITDPEIKLEKPRVIGTEPVEEIRESEE